MQTVHTRIAPIFMSGGRLPKDVTWKHGWTVTGPALSQFLDGKTTKPPWFDDHCSRMQYAKDTLAQLTANASDKSQMYEQYDIAILNMYKVHHPRMFTGEFIPCVRVKPTEVEPMPFDICNLTQDILTNKRKIDEIYLGIDRTL